MRTSTGPITLDRADGSLATLSIQGQPDRAVALKRRETAELMAEELRRLDPDDTYASALRYGVERLTGSTAPETPVPAPASALALEPARRETPAESSDRATPALMPPVKKAATK
jgi:hypothetical protein